MNIVGVVVEYNPFHNGHLYHLQETKKKYPESIIIAIMSGNFMQRGQIALVSKWEKTRMALHYGVDIVLDLPFVYANESADFFAENSLKILDNFNVDTIVFGSESNDVQIYYDLADIQLNNNEYNECVKSYLDLGQNYPTACSNALLKFNVNTVRLPNDILGLAYVKAIMKNDFKIKADIVKRTNNFHSTDIEEISSATSIRKAILEKSNFEIAVPKFTFNLLKDATICDTNDFFELLKYKIVSSDVSEIAKIHLVEEGLEFKIKKSIYLCDDHDSLVRMISSKRYTYSKVSRILQNILVNYTKEENVCVSLDEYYRVLGFSANGQSYLKKLKDSGVCYDVHLKNIENTVARVEVRAAEIYTLINKKYRENYPVIISTYK